MSAGQLVYTLFTEERGIRAEIAGPVVAGYWGALTLGRVVFGQIATRCSREAILRFGACLSPIGVVLVWVDASDWVSFAGVWILGFGLAPIFPMMVSVTPRRLGPAHGANAIGLQMSAASLGIAVLPGLGAVLMREVGAESLSAYLFVLAGCVLVLHEVAMRLVR